MEHTAYEPLSPAAIEALWGGPLPQLEPEYEALAAEYAAGRPEIAPYVMKLVFSLEDARLALALPGSAEQAGAAVGLSAGEAEDRLMAMAVRGKIMKTPEGYDRIRNIAFFKDYVYAHAQYDREYPQALARLMIAWDAYIPGRSNPDGTFRIIPKWESIQDLPGVMPCENMPQMLLDCLPDQIAFTRCPCRAVKTIAEHGEYRPGTGRCGCKETADPKDGVCLIVGPRANYFIKMYGAYHPTKEELLQKIREIEHSGAYYTTNNNRMMRVMCNCADDCDCGMRIPYEAGNDNCFAKSRFLATLAHPDRCVGCGLCERSCMFHRSIQVVDGKAVVDETGCHGCGVCVVKCPAKALEMRLVRPASHIPKPGQ